MEKTLKVKFEGNNYIFKQNGECCQYLSLLTTNKSIKEIPIGFAQLTGNWTNKKFVHWANLKKAVMQAVALLNTGSKVANIYAYYMGRDFKEQKGLFISLKKSELGFLFIDGNENSLFEVNSDGKVHWISEKQINCINIGKWCILEKMKTEDMLDVKRNEVEIKYPVNIIFKGKTELKNKLNSLEFIDESLYLLDRVSDIRNLQKITGVETFNIEFKHMMYTGRITGGTIYLTYTWMTDYITVAHEYAHYIDKYISGGYALSVKNPEKIKELRNNIVDIILESDTLNSNISETTKRKEINWLKDRNEVFARAFGQYIVCKAVGLIPNDEEKNIYDCEFNYKGREIKRRFYCDYSSKDMESIDEMMTKMIELLLEDNETDWLIDVKKYYKNTKFEPVTFTESSTT